MSVGAEPRKEPADEELVLRFQQTADPQCFAELFARYRRQVYFACKGFFSDGSLGEDATQETFLRAYRNMHRFAGGNFGGWLMRIARNICIDMWRQRQPEAQSEDTEMSDVPSPEVLDQRSDFRLALEKVMLEMKALSPEQQLCLGMKIEGYSYEEIAGRTGLKLEAVKSHLQNGRRALWLRMKGTLSQLT